MPGIDDVAKNETKELDPEQKAAAYKAKMLSSLNKA
jgi:hypothetical protein